MNSFHRIVQAMRSGWHHYSTASTGTMNAFRRMAQTVRSGWHRYSRYMNKNGWRAQALNTGALMLTGDVIAQLLIERRRLGKDYDPVRTLRFGGSGMVVFGPVMHVWYSSLDRYIRVAKTPLRLAVYKMLCDQLLFLPIYLAGYITLIAVLEGSNKEEVKERLQTNYSKLLMFSYQLWPVVQVANFYFVPLHHQIFLINTVGLIYYTYIDYTVEQHTAYCEQDSEEKDEKNNTKTDLEVKSAKRVGLLIKSEA